MNYIKIKKCEKEKNQDLPFDENKAENSGWNFFPAEWRGDASSIVLSMQDRDEQG